MKYLDEITDGALFSPTRDSPDIRKSLEIQNNESKTRAASIRFLAACMVNKAASGHLGMPLGMADVAAILWSEFINFNPLNPIRDRFILSCGHGSALLYSILYLMRKLTIDDLKQFRQIDSRTPGHPEYSPDIGIELTTGPLGQGLACAMGMTSPDYWTYVFCSDGDLMEGITHEALALGSIFSKTPHPKSTDTNLVTNIIVFWDDNQITIDGPTTLSCASDLGNIFTAHEWQVIEIDGHNYDEIRNSIVQAKLSLCPTCIRCKTKIGRYMDEEGTERAHSGKIRDLEAFKTRIGMAYPDFELPKQLLDLWVEAIDRGDNYLTQELCSDWQKIHSKNIPSKANFRDFSDSMYVSEDICEKEQNEGRRGESNPNQKKSTLSSTPVPQVYSSHPFSFTIIKNNEAIDILIPNGVEDVPKNMSTRKMFEYILRENPEIMSGSADLGDSTCTKTSQSYIHFGVREHAMIAFALGKALVGERISVGTFLSFTDYAKPSIRLAAIMNAKLLIIATHDSIGVGEDGPTHQPIEQLASLRLIPNLQVFRPANFAEMRASVALSALAPSIIACTRQNVQNFDSFISDCIKGGYLLSQPENPSYTLLATGSEVQIALQVASILPGARIISIPCLEILESQSNEYKNQLLGSLPRFSIEAGSTAPWYKYADFAFGIDEFGKSCSAEELFNIYLSPTKIAEKIREYLKM